MWKVEISDENNDKFHNLVLQNDDELLATKKINIYFTKEPLGDHIHILVSSGSKNNIIIQKMLLLVMNFFMIYYMLLAWIWLYSIKYYNAGVHKLLC